MCKDSNSETPLREVHSKKIIKDLLIDYANRLLPEHFFCNWKYITKY